MQYKINTVEETTTSTGKTYKRANIADEFGKNHDVSVWPDYPAYEAVEEGSMVEGMILTKGKYKNLVEAGRQATPYSKSSNIAVAQQRKENSIEQAQNRTAEMWARRSAAEIVAHHPAYQDLQPLDIEETIEKLARAILKMDIRPEPFK